MNTYMENRLKESKSRFRWGILAAGGLALTTAVAGYATYQNILRYDRARSELTQMHTHEVFIDRDETVWGHALDHIDDISYYLNEVGMPAILDETAKRNPGIPDISNVQAGQHANVLCNDADHGFSPKPSQHSVWEKIVYYFDSDKL